MTVDLLVVAAVACVGIALWARGRARGELLARACHEIRGPLTSVGLGVHLSARLGEMSPDRARAIELELDRAALAVSDAASLARAGWGRCQPDPDAMRLIDLAALLLDSIGAWRPAAGARELSLELPVGFDVEVWGQRARLAQATGNLIANALEHGGGPVRVTAACRAGAVWVEVCDCGPGLPAPIAALNAGRRRRPGRRERGHGLRVVAEVARAHGGRVFSAPAQTGARVVLELPVSSHDRAASAVAAG